MTVDVHFPDPDEAPALVCSGEEAMVGISSLSDDSSEKSLELTVELHGDSRVRGTAPRTHTQNAKLTAAKSMRRLPVPSSAPKYSSRVEGGESVDARTTTARHTGPSNYLVGKLMTVPVREPPVAGLLPYTDLESWNMRLVALCQNGIRREVRDLYFMLSSLSKRQYFVETEEIDDLLVWFELFATAVVEIPSCMAKATKSLFGEAQNSFSLSVDVFDALDEISTFLRNDTALKAPGDMVQGILPLADTLSEALHSCFYTQQCAPALKRASGLSVEAVSELESKFMVKLRKSPRSHLLAQIAIRWAEEGSIRKRLRGAYLYKSRMVHFGWRNDYLRSKAQFAEEHSDIVLRFHARWNGFHKEYLQG